MKLEIIETSDYVLAVSGEEIKKSTCDLTNGRDVFDYKDVHEYSLEYANKYWQKIIAYQPKGNAAELNLPLLPETVVEDEVEKLFIPYYFEKFNVPYFPSDLKKTCNWWFKAGYKAATKVYSEDDLKKAIELSRIKGDYKFDGKPVDYKYSNEEIVKTLKQPKWFVAEIEEWLDQTYSEHGCYRQKLKTTTINDKTYLIGTYE